MAATKTQTIDANNLPNLSLLSVQFQKLFKFLQKKRPKNSIISSQKAKEVRVLQLIKVLPNAILLNPRPVEEDKCELDLEQE